MKIGLISDTHIPEAPKPRGCQGDNFLEINGVWYSERGSTHTRCNTCEDHTDQVFYQNEDDETFICLCSCWTDSIMDRDPRAVVQRRR